MSNTIQGLPSIDPVDFQQKMPGASTSSDSSSGFWDTLKSTLDQVQQVQNEADQKVTDLVTGKGEDIHSAMAAVEKADLSFELVMQVRNKIVQAYQQVSQIQF
jgi:flagellar hook-basal body complex protein FliE